MKSLLILRSPLLKRKKLFGILKTRKKILGDLYVDTLLDALHEQEVKIITSSFSRSKETAEKIKSLLKNNSPSLIQVSPSIQDLDDEGCVNLLKNLDSNIDSVVLIVPGVTATMLLEHLTGTKKIILSGHGELVRFNINTWSELSNSRITNGQIKVLKNAIVS